MPILEPNRTPATAVSCVREVRLGVPLELLPEAHDFYHRVLDLPVWAMRLAVPGGTGFGKPRCGLYLQFAHDPEVRPQRRRLTLTVSDLDLVQTRLEECEWPHRRIRGFGWSDHCIQLHDPAGHLLELRQSSVV